MFIGAIIGTVLLTGCGENREVAYRQVQVQELEQQVADLSDALRAKDNELNALRNQPAPEPVVVDNSADLNRQLEGSGANAEIRGGEVVITVTNDILFKSGSADLGSKAKGSLDIVARVIKENYSGQYVRIEGHTDNQPIRRTKTNGPTTGILPVAVLWPCSMPSPNVALALI